MDREYDLIVEKLAHIRDTIFEESDFVSEEGYDLLGAYVSSPYEVLCGIEKKLIKQKEVIKSLT